MLDGKKKKVHKIGGCLQAIYKGVRTFLSGRKKNDSFSGRRVSVDKVEKIAQTIENLKEKWPENGPPRNATSETRISALTPCPPFPEVEIRA